MKKHVKVFLEFWDLGEQDLLFAWDVTEHKPQMCTTYLRDRWVALKIKMYLPALLLYAVCVTLLQIPTNYLIKKFLKNYMKG